MHKSGSTQNAEVLGHGRLIDLQACDDVSDGVLARREEGKDLAAARLSDSVENV